MDDDEKRTLLPTKDERDGLPAPAATPSPSVQRRCRFRKLFRFAVVFALVYAGILHWARVFKPQVEQEAARWLANPFAHHWRGHHGPKHGKEHSPDPILNGKLAEELFLCVCLPVVCPCALKRGDA